MNAFRTRLHGVCQHVRVKDPTNHTVCELQDTATTISNNRSVKRAPSLRPVGNAVYMDVTTIVRDGQCIAHTLCALHLVHCKSEGQPYTLAACDEVTAVRERYVVHTVARVTNSLTILCRVYVD
jgi:hypothetical protein